MAPRTTKIQAIHKFIPIATLRYKELIVIESKGIKYESETTRVILPFCIAFSQNKFPINVGKIEIYKIFNTTPWCQ